MDARLWECCKQLKLGSLEQFCDQVPFQEPRQYLTQVLELVLEHRQRKRAEHLVKGAGFPTIKTLEGYDFSPITFPLGLDQESLTSLSFLERRESLLLVGAVGTGKTHLALALGMKACSQGRRVKFYRVADLSNELVERHRAGKVSKLVDEISKADLLILDEMAYVPFSEQAAQLLFTVISRSYETQSTVVTSNLEFGRWNEVFGDDRLTAAIIDRLVHHAHILGFSGESYRLRQALARRQGQETGGRQ